MFGILDFGDMQGFICIWSAHPLTLAKVRWLGQGRSLKGAGQVKPPNGLVLRVIWFQVQV